MRKQVGKRQLVVRAFRKLQKQGILARANYLCCTSCASASLAKEAKQTGAKGGVYWHAQDEEALRQESELHLGFVGADFDVEKTVDVGRRLTWGDG